MTHPIIKTENYLLVVDESEIKDDDWHLDNGVIKKWKGNLHSNRLTSKKIIYHLPLNNAPTLEGVPLLPPLEESICPYPEEKQNAVDWHNGYNKAKEKYKWTNEDVIRIVEKSRETGLTAEYLIQSLQQPKYPVAFECEMEYKDMVGYWYKVDKITKETVNRLDLETRPKTITNSQGLTQIVGKYIYL
jgi:hypothetical protein